MSKQYKQLSFRTSVTFIMYRYMNTNSPVSTNILHIAWEGCWEKQYSFLHWKHSKPYWRKSWVMWSHLRAEPALNNRLHWRLSKLSFNLNNSVIWCPPNSAHVFPWRKQMKKKPSLIFLIFHTFFSSFTNWQWRKSLPMYLAASPFSEIYHRIFFYHCILYCVAYKLFMANPNKSVVHLGI